MASNKEVVERSHFTDWKSARDILRKLREGRKRDSKTVVELGKVLVQSYSRKLGSEGLNNLTKICIILVL